MMSLLSCIGHAAERDTRGKSVNVIERLYIPGTAETTKSSTVMRPAGSALPVVPPVNRALGGLSPMLEGKAEMFTVAFKGVTL